MVNFNTAPLIAADDQPTDVHVLTAALMALCFGGRDKMGVGWRLADRRSLQFRFSNVYAPRGTPTDCPQTSLPTPRKRIQIREPNTPSRSKDRCATALRRHDTTRHRLTTRGQPPTNQHTQGRGNRRRPDKLGCTAMRRPAAAAGRRAGAITGAQPLTQVTNRKQIKIHFKVT